MSFTCLCPAPHSSERSRRLSQLSPPLERQIAVCYQQTLPSHPFSGSFTAPSSSTGSSADPMNLPSENQQFIVVPCCCPLAAPRGAAASSWAGCLRKDFAEDLAQRLPVTHWSASPKETQRAHLAKRALLQRHTGFSSRLSQFSSWWVVLCVVMGTLGPRTTHHRFFPEEVLQQKKKYCDIICLLDLWYQEGLK